MCGICGKLNRDAEAPASPALLRRMMDLIAHRGPDAAGEYFSGPVALGHRRLAIIDLSRGVQPMTNEDETVWIVFNGEIYNFQELHDQLVARGHVFRSRSDTEVIIHLYEEFGPECVTQLRGMFAFAIWDSNRRRLFLARDRVGIKPLYYAQTEQAFWFASELKAILADPDVARTINPEAIRTFLSFNYLPGETTLLQGIRKLLPGHYLLVEQGKVITRQYWDLRFTCDRWNVSFADATAELHSLLADAVRSHMIADVPVGVLLSGGVDSSAVASFAVQQTGQRVKTFTVGFAGDQVVDERPYARLVAEKFGTEHYETSITADDFWTFLPAYVKHMEEPVCEPPAVALYYVSRLARDHVKVVLSGEGGDEAFAGYSNYRNLLRLEAFRSRLGPLARPVGAIAGWMGRLASEPRLHRYGHALGRPLTSYYFSRTSGPTSYFNRSSRQLFSDDFLSQTRLSSAPAWIAALAEPVRERQLLERMLYVDTKTWLPDDLLVKADKMTMATAIELRVPLLDHLVLEFAASLPPEFKVQGAQTKRVLKAAFARVLPEEILTRKKAGFPVPYENWLRNGLNQHVHDVLLSRRALERGYFRDHQVARLLSANARHGMLPKEVFCLLALELWHQEFMDRPAVPA